MEPHKPDTGGEKRNPKEKAKAEKKGKKVAGTDLCVEDLAQAAAQPDRGGLTKAGRALAKHGNRPGSIFPKPKGNPQQMNQQAQEIVEEILNNPGTTITTRTHPRFGEIIEVRAPDGRRIIYDKHGNFITFFEP